MLVLLGLQLITVERQRRIAARREGRARESIQAVEGQARAFLREGRDAVPPVQAGLRRADRLVRALSRRHGPRAIAAAGELAQRLQNADLAGRVQIISRGTVETLTVARRLESIARETGIDVETLRAVTIRFQRRTLRLQRQSLAILQRSLAVQEETLVRIRRIDERTGGALPVVAP